MSPDAFSLVPLQRTGRWVLLKMASFTASLLPLFSLIFSNLIQTGSPEALWVTEPQEVAVVVLMRMGAEQVKLDRRWQKWRT